jgi:very-short-patch-repair endonuclease
MDQDMSGERTTEFDRHVAELAATQLGAFTRAQVVELGGTRAHVDHRLATGRWVFKRRNVYVIAGTASSFEQTAMVAVLWAGAGSVISHGCAATLWDFDCGCRQRVELWTPRRLKADDIAVHRGTRIDRADRTMLGPIAITTPERTLIDVSARLEDVALSGLLESTIKAGLVAEQRLLSRLGALQSSGRAGAGRLGRLVAGRGDGPAMESTLEAVVWTILVEAGVRMPMRQHWVNVPGGRYRLDFAWPDVKVAVECDGFDAHGSTRARFGKDRARYSELVASGYRVLPVTWSAARQQPDRVLRWLEDTLALAA